jgi:radical SAM superfamily enzyme YgiQ (UPF0313 family)
VESIVLATGASIEKITGRLFKIHSKIAKNRPETLVKILHINPPFTGFGGMSGHGGKQAPLNLCYLAAEIRKNHPQIEQIILDGENLRLDFDGIEKEVERHKPDIVTMTFPTPAYVSVKTCAERVKKISPSIPIVVGGPHPSAFAEQVLKDESLIDICVIGEGEKTFSEIISKIFFGGSLEDVDGLAFRNRQGEIVRTKKRQLIANLDDLDFPARDLLPNIKYYSVAAKRVSSRVLGNMITSRGCPYDCTYCESKVIWSRKARMRSPENVVDEIEEMVKVYGIGEINFHDDILPMRRDRTLEISKLIQKRDVDIRWMCMSRVNFVWEDVMREMYKAGCRRIMFGLESGSQEILKNIKKKSTLEQAYEAVKICRKVKIQTMGSFMIGNIGETPETIRESIEFAKKLDLDTASFFVTIPYPGTDLFREAVDRGYIRGDLNWKEFTVVGENSGPMQLPGLSNDELRYWQSKALQEFYLRPKYIWKKFTNINSLKEFFTLLSGARMLFSLARVGSKAKSRAQNRKSELSSI